MAPPGIFTSASARPPGPLEPNGTHVSRTILVADDEAAIVRAVTRFLERAGHEVHSAGTADEAVALIDVVAFDAAFVDSNMPGDGRTVLRRLAEDADFDGPAYLMTGDLPDPDEELPGGARHLQKPFDFTGLAALVSPP